jgi:hypothetical protein
METVKLIHTSTSLFFVLLLVYIYVRIYVHRCPYMERLNASNNAGIDGVFILKKPHFAIGDEVEVDWRGRGQYFKV